MTGFLGGAYPWVKAAHVIFVIFWMAGLLIFPRFLVYHRASAPRSPEDAAWGEREARLRRVILTPAMIAVWLLGLALAANLGLFEGQPGLGWLHAKLALVVALSGYHGWAVGFGKKLAQGLRPGTDKGLRLANELPSLATIAIVILVIVKPF